APREAGPSWCRAVQRLLPRLAFHFNVHAAVRLQARDQCLSILLIALNHRLSFAHANCLDLVLWNTLADEIVAHSIRPPLRKLLVVRLRAEAISVSGDQDDFELLHLRELPDDLAVDCRLAL